MQRPQVVQGGAWGIVASVDMVMVFLGLHPSSQSCPLHPVSDPPCSLPRAGLIGKGECRSHSEQEGRRELASHHHWGRAGGTGRQAWSLQTAAEESQGLCQARPRAWVWNSGGNAVGPREACTVWGRQQRCGFYFGEEILRLYSESR